MILSSDTELTNILPVFSSLGINTSFLVPTETAMEKSIMDATSSVRKHLLTEGLHNFDQQEQGTHAKVIKTAFFVFKDRLEKTQTSLYRPSTKMGDPRIWFYKLNSYAKKNNLLAVIAKNDVLYVINCSKKEIIQSLESGSNPLLAALNISTSGLSEEAEELLTLLRQIGQNGWIESMRPGDTGVGFTLETLLGISANSNTTPDFKGVELKSARKRSSNQTLFSKTPDWNISRLKSSLEILNERGRYSTKNMRRQLNHSIFGNKQNSYGLQLEVDFEEDNLLQFCLEQGKRTDDVIWSLQTLQNALRKKHNQTFWVKTETRQRGTKEEFLYSEAIYTRSPNIDAFPLLLENGQIFVDFTIKETNTGSASDHGYFFRMKKNNLESLFGIPQSFALI